MSESLIRAQIATILSGVSGIGVIHDRRRYNDTWVEWFALMTSAGKINGWTINREETPADNDADTIYRHHLFVITGFMDIDDSAGSESTFQGILDAIFDAFKENRELNGTAFDSGPINVDHVRADLFGDELVNRLLHVAQLNLLVEEQIVLV